MHMYFHVLPNRTSLPTRRQQIWPPRHSTQLTHEKAYYWGQRDWAPPVELNVPPVYIYICTYILVPGWHCAMLKRKAGLRYTAWTFRTSSGTHSWLTDALPYSLRGNGVLQKLCCCVRQEERASCQCVRTTFQAGDSWDERSSPTHSHPAAETGIRDRQVWLQKASYIVETVHENAVTSL